MKLRMGMEWYERSNIALKESCPFYSICLVSSKLPWFMVISGWQEFMYLWSSYTLTGNKMNCCNRWGSSNWKWNPLPFGSRGKTGPKASKIPTYWQAHPLLSQHHFFGHSKLTIFFSILLSFIFDIQGGNIWGNWFFAKRRGRENYIIHHNMNSIILFFEKIWRYCPRGLLKWIVFIFLPHNQALYFIFKCPLTISGLL